MEKQIIIIKPKSLSPKDKEKLTKAGNIVIEHDKSYEITFRPHQNTDEYVYTNCSSCGERVYLLSERLRALKTGKSRFYCSHGHEMRYQ